MKTMETEEKYKKNRFLAGCFTKNNVFSWFCKWIREAM